MGCFQRPLKSSGCCLILLQTSPYKTGFFLWHSCLSETIFHRRFSNTQNTTKPPLLLRTSLGHSPSLTPRIKIGGMWLISSGSTALSTLARGSSPGSWGCPCYTCPWLPRSPKFHQALKGGCSREAGEAYGLWPLHASSTLKACLWDYCAKVEVWAVVYNEMV